MKKEIMDVSRRRLLWIIKLLVLVSAFYYLFATNRFEYHHLALQPGSAMLLLAVLLMLVAGQVASFLRFWLMLMASGCDLPLGWTIKVGFIGSFCNVFMPGGIGGDLVRMGFVVSRCRSRSSQIAVCTALDRVLGLFGLLLVGAAALVIDHNELSANGDLRIIALTVFGILTTCISAALGGIFSLSRGRIAGFLAGVLVPLGAAIVVREGILHHQDLRSEIHLVGCCAAFGAMLTALLAPSCQPGGRFASALECLPLGPLVVRLVQAVLYFRTRIMTILACLLISLVVQLLTIVCLFVTSQTIVIEPTPSFLQVAVSAPLAIIANMLPVSVGGIGVGEAAFANLLSLNQIDGQAVGGGAAVFLLFRLCSYLTFLIGLPFYLRLENRQTKAMASEESLRESMATETAQRPLTGVACRFAASSSLPSDTKG